MDGRKHQTHPNVRSTLMEEEELSEEALVEDEEAPVEE